MKYNIVLYTAIVSLIFIHLKTFGQHMGSIGNQTAVADQWKGKQIAFLGDSMTEKRNKDTPRVYWEYLTELLGIQPYVYGISGNQWDGIYRQAQKLHDEHKDHVDAIIIFAGTNDYNHSLPLGTFFRDTTEQTNHNGIAVTRKRRIFMLENDTFCGRINIVLSYLKQHFPKQQIILLTPIHRGYAKFNEKNVQPDESYANGQGLYLDDYVNKIKQAGSNWSVPVIDLYALSGLYPLATPHADYFRHADTDLLHLNASGNYRLAKTIQHQLMALPSTFRDYSPGK